jgi:hypothetical protein
MERPGSGSRGRIYAAYLALSYNRYALALVGGAALLAAAAWVHLPWPSVAAVATVLLALPACGFAWTIASRQPRKIAATFEALARLRSGTFRTEELMRFAGDPCSRVVADHILSLAGMPRKERWSTIRALAREHAERGTSLVILDRSAGVLIEIDGKRSITHTLRAESGEMQHG